MRTFKTLGFLMGLIGVLAFSATPASAWFKSTQTQGTIKPLASGVFTDAGAEVICPTNEIKAQWYIQTKGQIKKHQIEEKQLLTTEGPHQNIQIKWGNKAFDCKTTATGLKEVETNVSACELQLQQQKGSKSALGGVVTACIITIGKTVCEMEVMAGMETEPGSGLGINVGLTETTLTNKGSGSLLTKVNVTGGGKGQLGTGVRVNQIPGHPLCPVKTNEAGTLTGLEFEAENEEEI